MFCTNGLFLLRSLGRLWSRSACRHRKQCSLNLAKDFAPAVESLERRTLLSADVSLVQTGVFGQFSQVVDQTDYALSQMSTAR